MFFSVTLPDTPYNNIQYIQEGARIYRLKKIMKNWAINGHHFNKSVGQ